MRKNGKYFISVVCAIAMLFCSAIAFSACGAGETEYRTEDLTPANYYGYLSVELQFDGFDAEYDGEDALGTGKYRVFCAGKITVKRVGNYQFDYASVTVNLTVEDGWNVSLQEAKIPLDYDGNGEYSFFMEKTLMTSFVDNTFTSDDCDIHVSGAAGTVYIYE